MCVNDDGVEEEEKSQEKWVHRFRAFIFLRFSDCLVVISAGCSLPELSGSHGTIIAKQKRADLKF